MWRWIVLLLAACGSTTSSVGDRRCTSDSECQGGQRCVLVQSVRISTGDCLASSGAMVCRPVCSDCAQAAPCGCQCPP